jgi:septal ring factor EnvC (AmiA/AmiB activator)
VTRLAPLVVLSAILAFVAVGCGGPSAEEKWAGTVCSDIGDWQDQIQKSVSDIREEIQSPKPGTLAAIDAEVEEAADATRQLVSNLRALGAPETESGDQAKQQVDALATQLDATVTQAKQTVDSLPQNADVSQIAQTFAPLLPSLQSLAVKVSSTLASVQASGSKLKEGFEKADSCEQFREANRTS